MTVSIQKIIEETKDLSPNDRAFLAHCLISSLDTVSENDVDDSWAELAQKRYNELKNGTVKAVSWDELKQEIIK